MTQAQNLSERTAQAVDEEVRALVTAAEAKAREVLTERREELERVAGALIEYETLTAEQVARILDGESLEPGGNDAARQASVIPLAGRRKDGGTAGQPDRKSAA